MTNSTILLTIHPDFIIINMSILDLKQINIGQKLNQISVHRPLKKVYLQMAVKKVNKDVQH